MNFTPDTANRLDPVAVAGHLRISTARLARALRQNDTSGFGPTVIAALATVSRSGPITLGELATAEQVAPPSITKIAGRLVEAGLVERQVDPEDRRVVRLEITPAGLEQLDSYRSRRTTWLVERLDRCSADELTILDIASQILERLVQGEPTPSDDA